MEEPPVKVVLINPYELGRQPFALAQPAAWLARAGFEVRCIDLAIEAFDAQTLADAGVVAVSLPMHTATRIALEALDRIRALAPEAKLCAYGLYAPVNERLLRRVGFSAVLGGEAEASLVSFAERVRAGDGAVQSEPVVSLAKLDFLTPARDGLPPLDRYATLRLPAGGERRMAFTEASRGCKHLCRHCPVVPVYEGRFRVVPVEVVLADIRTQVAEGAEHVSFGDPDFLNGPTHALRVVDALHREFPKLTYDATIKVEHLIKHAGHLGHLRETGCVLVTSAFESVDERILERLAKGHTGTDLDRAVDLLERAGIALAPTFVPFTPWTTLAGYLDLLAWLARRRLVSSVPPVQLALRLLVPAGSHLLHLDDMRALAGPLDDERLGHPWRHPEPAVDELQLAVQAIAERAEAAGEARASTFAALWRLAHERLDRVAPALPDDLGQPGPQHSEAWYCCAEPTARQLGAAAASGPA